MRDVITMCLMALLTLATATAFQGCQPGVLTPPAEAWVRADRATFDIVAPRFASYVHADTALSTNIGLRDMLLGLLNDWQFRLQTAEAQYPPPGLPEPVPPEGASAEVRGPPPADRAGGGP